jgi:hypothetical protein
MEARLDYDMGLFKKHYPNKNDAGSIWFTNREEAKTAADFIYKMGGWAMVLSDIYEYYPWEGSWNDMVY